MDELPFASLVGSVAAGHAAPFVFANSLFHDATPRLRPTPLVGRRQDTSSQSCFPVLQIAGLRLSEVGSAGPHTTKRRGPWIVAAKRSRPRDQQILKGLLETHGLTNLD